MPGPAGWTAFTEEQITNCLMAVVAWAGQCNPAAKSLEEKGISVSAPTLKRWITETHAERYEQMREKYKDQLEQVAANNMRDLIALSQEGTRLALEKEIERLEKGEEPDPARAAANMARVSQSSTDKLMTLTQRPTTITENRNMGEILRSLVAGGYVSLPDEEHPQIEAGTDSNDGG